MTTCMTSLLLLAAAQAAMEPFRFDASSGTVAIWGRGTELPRRYFDERLPAVFERTLVLREFDAGDGALEWIFTGDRAGFTVRIDNASVYLGQRYYQRVFINPDAYDAVLQKFSQATSGKPFLSTEISVNNSAFQTSSYRLALAMGQLYHKNLTITNASALLYCWLLLNVKQPSYGWTRSLFVPDGARGSVPVASSFQLRVFGAYSRRVLSGMVRVDAASSDSDLLATAFQAADGERTLVLLNRSTRPQRVAVDWPGKPCRVRETADPY